MITKRINSNPTIKIYNPLIIFSCRKSNHKLSLRSVMLLLFYAKIGKQIADTLHAIGPPSLSINFICFTGRFVTCQSAQLVAEIKKQNRIPFKILFCCFLQIRSYLQHKYLLTLLY